ncbi:Imm50 family immunity protein [Streptomyces griseochromogenes]|uniref:Imm50 family immunity protein n=1 Tax=Streptomyces griseochromogenes TaxID=68214 RepID=UPI00379B654D
MGGDWQRLLASPDCLGVLYGEDPPPPDACDLFSVHIDERGNSVTLGFDTRRLPVNPPAEWERKGLNAFEFHLVFTGVTGLRVTGWGAAEAKRVRVSFREGGGFDVVLGAEESGIVFGAAAVRPAGPRAYLASDSP